MKNRTHLSGCEDGHINPASCWISGGLFQSFSVKSGCLLHIHNVHGVAESHPGVGLSQPDQALQLPGIGGDLTSAGANLPHLNIVLDELLSGSVR